MSSWPATRTRTGVPLSRLVKLDHVLTESPQSPPSRSEKCAPTLDPSAKKQVTVRQLLTKYWIGSSFLPSTEAVAFSPICGIASSCRRVGKKGPEHSTQRITKVPRPLATLRQPAGDGRRVGQEPSVPEHPISRG